MITVTTAYGRDYTSAKDARADWLADKDFILQDFGNRWDGKPVSRPQLDGPVQIRFAGLRKVTVVNPGEEA
ncbi:MAG: hypothetical protein PVI97_00275 [Candidatus Thiodiazotropha sp.]|jgi:hypothetical protein